MTRQVTDQLYIDLGYFTPENYFVYQANAQLTAASTATITVSIGVNKVGASTQTATANISCDATRLRTQSADASLSASASFSSDAVKTVDVQSTQSAEFALSGSAGRIQQGQGSFTGAFSPTLTVEVIKNHTAILDVVFSVTTVGVANRATSITTSTIAALDAQAAKTVDIQSNQTSTATISTQAVTTKSATSTLTSTVTVTCEAFNVQFASASLSVGSSIFTTRYFGVGRPFNLTRNGGGAITFTTDSKFGSYALLDDVVVFQKGLPLINGYDKNQMVVQGWIKPLDTNSTGIFISPGVSVGGPFELRKNGATVRFITYYNFGGNRTLGNEYTSPSFTANNWYHWALVFNGTNVAFFWNGSRAGPIGGVVDLWNSSVLGDSFRIIARSGDWILDEISIHKDTTLGYDPTSSTITVPTSAGTNNDSTTLALWHFENNGLDDTTIGNQTGSATLSSTASISAQGRQIAVGSASLTSQSTISVIGSLLNVAQASLTSTATVSAVIGTLESAQSSLTSAFTSQIQAQKTTDITSSQSAQISTQVDQIRIRNFAGAFTGAFTPTLTIDVLKNHTAILDAVSTVTAQVNGQFDSLISISAQATLTTTVTVIEQGASDLAATVTLSAQATRLPSSGSMMSAEATISVIAGLRQSQSASITSQSTLAIVATRLAGLTSTQSVQATWVETIPAIFRNLGDQTLSAQASLTAIPFRTKLFDSAITAQANVSIQPVKTANGQSTISAQSTVSTQPVITADAQTNFASIATQLSAAFVNATGTILLESTATVTALIGVIKPFETPNVSGVQMRKPRWVQYTSAITSSLNDHTVIAFWARKIGATSGRFIWNRERSFEIFPGGLPGGNWNYNRYEHTYGFSNRTTFYFSGYNETGPAGTASLYLEFPNTIPDDQNWHHYVVYWQKFQPNSLGNGYIMRLYIDGSQVGIQTSLAPANRRITAGWYDPLDLGYDTQVEMGQLAVWNSASDFIINDFANIDPDLYNNGYVELGSSGTVNGNTPYIYDRLDNPFSANVRGVLNNTLSDPRNETYFTLTEANQAEDRLYGNQAFFNLSASFLGVFLFASNLTATSTLTCAGNFTAGAASTQTTQATMVTQPVAQIGIVSAQSSIFTLTADVNLAPAGGAALADHQATLECVIGYLRFQASTQSVTATMTTEAMVIPPVSGDAVLTVFATQTTIAGYLISSQSTQSSIFTQVTEATEIDPIRADAQLTVTAQLTCVMTRVRPGISLEMSAGTLTCEATVIPPIRTEANLASAFTLTVTINAAFDTITLTVSLGTVTCTAVKTATITGQFTASTQVLAIPFKRTGIVALLQAQGFTLIAGDVINIDPYLTLRIRPENRLISIEAETRTVRIRPESRTLTIEGYTT